jgi:hypothetical protein
LRRFCATNGSYEGETHCKGSEKEVGIILVNKALSGDIDTRIPMETIHGAELVVLSFPEHNAGAYIGGLFTLGWCPSHV